MKRRSGADPSKQSWISNLQKWFIVILGSITKRKLSINVHYVASVFVVLETIEVKFVQTAIIIRTIEVHAWQQYNSP